MFINSKLYKKAYNWLTMGLGDKMPMDNAKIVEMSAYAPLTTSTIVGKRNNVTPEEEFNVRQEYDTYKKNYAIAHGYNYLVIPYWSEKDEKYKEIIDSKIEEIVTQKCA